MSARSRAILAALAGGVFIGVLGRASGHLSDVVRWTAALGAPWLVTAFVVGAAVRSPRWLAALAGGAALALGVGVYYSVFHFVEGTTSLRYAAVVGFGWASVAALAGAAFGYAGAAWRADERWARVVAAAAVGGALLGEAVLLLRNWQDPTARAVLLAELAIGAAVPILSARRRELPAALMLGLTFAIVALACEGYARAALRVVGWAGA